MQLLASLVLRDGLRRRSDSPGEYCANNSLHRIEGFLIGDRRVLHRIQFALVSDIPDIERVLQHVADVGTTAKASSRYLSALQRPSSCTNILFFKLALHRRGYGQRRLSAWKFHAARYVLLMGRLDGQHIFVTGGGQGIGAATAEKCLNEGASVTIMDLKSVGSSRAFAVQGNVCKADDIARAHSAAKEKFGPVTGVVNNAGRNSYADPVKMTEAEWEDVFAVDLKASWLVARQMLPDMIAAKSGSIVNISSVHADMTYPGYFPYAAAKSGLVGLTRSLALEMGPHQIRVNALSPGYTETELVKEFFAMNEPSFRQKVLDVHPMGRIATPAEIANCICFLLSDEASFVTGANWKVDGGLTSRFAS